jgi:hypothetical protein
MPADEMSPETALEGSGEKNFVSLGSLKNYATATASLTLIINIILYAYSAIRSGQVMPVSLVIPMAIILSILYILSFFKRDKGLTSAQYIWITALNGLMLFTSISGVNGMLDSARQAFSKVNQGPAGDTVRSASVGSFFKHIFLPTHGWFNVTEMSDMERTSVINSTITSIDTTKAVISNLIEQKQKDINTIDTLSRQLDSVRTQYIHTLTQFTQVEATVSTLRSFVNEHDMQGNVRNQLDHLQTTIDVKKTELTQQRGEQREDQQENLREKQISEKQVVQLQQQQYQLQQQKRILSRQQVRQLQPQ